MFMEDIFSCNPYIELAKKRRFHFQSEIEIDMMAFSMYVW